MSPLPDIWLLRSDGERRVNRRLRVKTNFSLKFSKEESPIVRRDSQSLVVLPSLALSISPGGWAGEALASPGRREGWRMSWAGCHCDGRLHHTGDWQVPTPPPPHSSLCRAGRAEYWSSPLLSPPAHPSSPPTVPDSSRLPDWPDCVSPGYSVVVRPGPGPGPTSPHRSPDLSNVRRLIRWVSFWLESLGAKWDKIKKLKYWHRPV